MPLSQWLMNCWWTHNTAYNRKRLEVITKTDENTFLYKEPVIFYQPIAIGDNALSAF